MTTWRCPDCDAQARLTRGGAREAHVGSVAAALESVPELHCDAGHRSPAPNTDLTVVLAAINERIAQAAGGVRGDRCAACRTRLTMPTRRTTRSVPVVGASSAGVLTFHLDVPATRCPACGLDQVPRRSRADVAAAVRQALSARRRRPRPSPA